MEIVFTILLLIVPVFSVFSFALSLIVYKRNIAMKSLVLELAQLLRGGDVSPVDTALDEFRMRL